MIYLIKSASHNQDKIFYKIGFTNNLNQRLRQYVTNNPTVELLETVITYRKTKHSLEKALHKELYNRGYRFKIGLFNIHTEWFECDTTTNITLEQFKACQGRKVNKCTI